MLLGLSPLPSFTPSSSLYNITFFLTSLSIHHSSFEGVNDSRHPGPGAKGPALKCKERARRVVTRNLSPGLLLRPRRHGGYRSIDLVEMELSGPVAEGSGDFSVPRSGRGGQKWHPDPWGTCALDLRRVLWTAALLWGPSGTEKKGDGGKERTSTIHKTAREGP